MTKLKISESSYVNFNFKVGGGRLFLRSFFVAFIFYRQFSNFVWSFFYEVYFNKFYPTEFVWSYPPPHHHPISVPSIPKLALIPLKYCLTFFCKYVLSSFNFALNHSKILLTLNNINWHWHRKKGKIKNSSWMLIAYYFFPSPIHFPFFNNKIN